MADQMVTAALVGVGDGCVDDLDELIRRPL